MALASLLLTLSVYMLIPVLPQWMMHEQNMSPVEAGLAMGCFGVGLYLLGVLCSWLVQRFRRNIVCMWAVAGVALCHAALLYLDSQQTLFADRWLLALLRTLHGAAFGLAQMVLASTLIIDTCESFQRTEANHSATWFSRFALSLGPMAGLLLSQLWSFDIVLLSAIGCLAVTIVLILMVHFPFRVPEDHLHLWSLDRFFLTRGWLLFFNLLLVSTGIGLVFSLLLDVQFYGLMMVGFLLALLAETFVFRDADLKSEVVSGLLLIVASLLILNFSPSSPLHSSLLGLGAGLVGARFLLFFIKLSRHCQRGTSQSTFLLGWESGLALGIGIGYSVFEMQKDSVLLCALLLVLLALAIYVTFVHGWFLKHRNR